MAPQASDVPADTTTKDVDINELGSTFSDLEGQVEGRNPATTQKSKIKRKKYIANVLGSKPSQFQAILQLLQLVVALNPEKRPSNEIPSTASRKAFDYVDAITNLMVRNGEVVAATACGGQLEHPIRGIISYNPSSKTRSDENAQVRPQYTTSYVKT
jgi:hypothetical protein